MPKPDFTDDEQYLINSVKSTQAYRHSNSYMWGYMAGAIAFFGVSTYHGNIPLMIIAFAILCGFRIYEEWLQAKWQPLWCTIIAKYEASAISEFNHAGPDGNADA